MKRRLTHAQPVQQEKRQKTANSNTELGSIHPIDDERAIIWSKDLKTYHPDIRVCHYPSFYNPKDSKLADIFRNLSELKLEKDDIKMFGRDLKTPRCVGFYGDPGTSYTFSGRKHDAKPIQELSGDGIDTYWHPFLLDIKTDLERFCTERIAPILNGENMYTIANQDKVHFDYVLINKYADGDDYIGYHTDDESDLRPDGIIASLSFGASRYFTFQGILKNSIPKKKTKRELVRFLLNDGDLCIMAAGTQKHVKHSIPKIAKSKCNTPRFNLTFRQLNHK